MTELEFIETIKEHKRYFDALPFRNRKKVKELRYKKRANRKHKMFNKDIYFNHPKLKV